MKNISLIIFAALFIVLSSCTKDNDDININHEQQNSENNDIWKDQGGAELCTLVEITHPVGEPGEWACLKPTRNCFCDPVVVTPDKGNSILEIYNEFISAIEKNQIDDFFNDGNWKLLFPLLAEPFAREYLTLLQNNDVILVMNYNPYKDQYLFIAMDKDFKGDIDPNDTYFTLQTKLEN